VTKLIFAGDLAFSKGFDLFKSCHLFKSSMRVEFEYRGTTYHVMARGSHGRAIYADAPGTARRRRSGDFQPAGANAVSTACGLEIRDTAEWNSALLPELDAALARATHIQHCPRESRSDHG
jgi:hypothetical protein